MISKHPGAFILSAFWTLIDGIFFPAGKGINTVMPTRETMLSWYSLRTTPNHHSREGGIKGIEKPSGVYSWNTWTACKGEKKIKSHNKTLAGDKHKILTSIRPLLETKINKYIKRSYCQNPAPPAGMKDEQKKLKIEAGCSSTALQAHCSQESYLFSLQMMGNANRIKRYRASQDKAFLGAFPAHFGNEMWWWSHEQSWFPCNVKKAVLQIWRSRPMQRRLQPKAFHGLSETSEKPQLLSTEKSFLDISTCFVSLDSPHVQPQAVFSLQFDFNKLNVILSQHGLKILHQGVALRGVSDRWAPGHRASRKTELKPSLGSACFSSTTSTWPSCFSSDFHLFL